MEEELKNWVLEEKKKLWNEYLQGSFTKEHLKLLCEILDDIFTNPPLN